MGWFSWGRGEMSSGSTGKISNVKVTAKSGGGGVKHVLVNKSGGNAHKNHTHYYQKSSGSWGSKTKGKG